MREQQPPFGYQLMPIREGRRQDFLFLRLYPGDPPPPDCWHMHMDLDDPRREDVLVFVRNTVPSDEVVSEINRVLSYFTRQIEPHSTDDSREGES